MEFENLKQLKEQWINHMFSYPENITVSGVPYTRCTLDTHVFESFVAGTIGGNIAYETSVENKDAAQEAELNRWIVFNWKSDGVSVLPHGLRAVSSDHFVRESTQDRIGDVVILKVMLPSGAGALKGKVDTGADICSMHAENIRIVGDVVKFISPELSRNELSLPVTQYHAVKSADGGTSNRPVIELDIEINGTPIRKIQFNLNDRNQMEYPVLIGQNALEKTNFLIDPNQDGVKENVEWNTNTLLTNSIIIEEFKDIPPIMLESSTVDKSKIEAVYKVLESSDVTLHDLVKYARSESHTVPKDGE